MLQKGIQPLGSKVLILGLAFKENCPDFRNTKVTDIVAELQSYGSKVEVYDPWVSASEVRDEYGMDLVTQPQAGEYDAIILAVAHREFKEMSAETLRDFGKPGAILYDIKYVLPPNASDDRL